jgi:hypothetical protein
MRLLTLFFTYAFGTVQTGVGGGGGGVCIVMPGTTRFTLESLRPEMDFLDINLTKDSSLLLHAIHSLSTGGFLKKTRLYSGFKNTYKKIREKLEQENSNELNTIL